MEVAAGDSRKEAVTRMTREGGVRTEEVVMPERELAVAVASVMGSPAVAEKAADTKARVETTVVKRVAGRVVAAAATVEVAVAEKAANTKAGGAETTKTWRLGMQVAPMCTQQRERQPGAEQSHTGPRQG